MNDADDPDDQNERRLQQEKRHIIGPVPAFHVFSLVEFVPGLPVSGAERLPLLLLHAEGLHHPDALDVVGEILREAVLRLLVLCVAVPRLLVEHEPEHYEDRNEDQRDHGHHPVDAQHHREIGGYQHHGTEDIDDMSGKQRLDLFDIRAAPLDQRPCRHLAEIGRRQPDQMSVHLFPGAFRDVLADLQCEILIECGKEEIPNI